MSRPLDGSAAAASLAYDEVKRRIMDCLYPPGTKLAEARLAAELGCGRSPVRTAFARLQSEGWIEVSPQSGTYVKSLSEREIQDIFELRLLLETHATRAAARHIGAAELRALRLSYERLAPECREGDPAALEAFKELDELFHATVYRAAGNARITLILLDLLEKARWLSRIYPATPRRCQVIFGELREILEALEARDGERAARVMRAHIGNAAEFVAQRRENVSAPPQGTTTR